MIWQRPIPHAKGIIMRGILPLLLVTLMLPVSAVAEPDNSDERRAEAMERMRTFRAVLITQELDLDEKTAIKLTARLNAIDDKVVALEQQRHAAQRALREATRAGSITEKELETQMKAIIAAEHALVDVRMEQFEATKGILEAEQRAHFLGLMRRIEQEMHERIRDARQERRHERRGMDEGPGHPPHR